MCERNRRIVAGEPAGAVFHLLNPRVRIRRAARFLEEVARLIVLDRRRIVIAELLPYLVAEIAIERVHIERTARHPHRISRLVASQQPQPRLGRVCPAWPKADQAAVVALEPELQKRAVSVPGVY